MTKGNNTFFSGNETFLVSFSLKNVGNIELKQIDMMYGTDANPGNLMTSMPNANNQQFCYTNCFVVNIDGPINFNSTHSLLDDGSDLPLNDVNTMRFYYNLGIEVCFL